MFQLPVEASMMDSKNNVGVRRFGGAGMTVALMAN
jgi:hypothetical protein